MWERGDQPDQGSVGREVIMGDEEEVLGTGRWALGAEPFRHFVIWSSAETINK